MPVSKCNGKWRVGKGKCIYDSEAKAEAAFKHWVKVNQAQAFGLEYEMDGSKTAYKFPDGHTESLALMEQRFNDPVVELKETLEVYDEEAVR